MSLWSLKELPTKTTRYGYILIQIVAFRIAFFPIVVFSAVVACYSELLLQHLSVDLAIKVFPAMFVSAALIFAAISFILFWALKGKTVLYVLMVVLGIPALLISFIYQKDLTILPYNNWADISPLPAISQPQANHFLSAVTSGLNNLWQKMFSLAGRALYEIIPKAQ